MGGEPGNENAAGAIDTWATYRGPTTGFLEEVFLIEPYADDDGWTAALLIAPGAALATSVTWNVSELPYFTQGPMGTTLRTPARALRAPQSLARHAAPP